MPPPSLHAGLIERARPLPSTRFQNVPKERSVLPEPREWETVAALPSIPGLARVVPRGAEGAGRYCTAPRASPPSLKSKRKRYGLTVRVASETREMLEKLRTETGQTFQHLLHQALVERLNKA